MRKILLLSNNNNVQTLYDWLVNKGYEVKLYHEPIIIDVIDVFEPDIVISFNYQHIVKEDVINRMGDRIINMHTSYLPWNKGASPNMWSFIDNTPKGVTIHRLEKGLDTGAIIIQKELMFDENVETLSSTYNKLNDEIIKLLIDNWDMFENGSYTMTPQTERGSYHRTSDLEALLKGRHIDYGMTIAEFKAFIKG